MARIPLFTSLPENNSQTYEYLYKKYVNTSVHIPQIKNIKNAFVTHEGLVVKKGLLVNGCAFNLRGKEDKTFYYTFWRTAIEQFLVSRYGKSLPSVHLKLPQTYLLIHSKWFNYSFWVTGFLPRLIQAEAAGWLKKSKLIVPEGWKKIPYVWDSLMAFDIEFEIIPDGHHIFADNLIMPETRQWTASFYPPSIKNTRIRLVTEALQRETNTDKNFSRIYLTRTKRGVRCVENEDEVIELVKKYDFVPVVFEDLTIWEQISLMNRATHFISIHGAGFSNIMFMKPDAKVLELINLPYAQQEYTFPFWKLANAAQLKYFSQFCDVKGAANSLLSYGKKNSENELEYLVNQNIIVDIAELEKNLKVMTIK
jgi:hypothetical protein